MIGNPLSRRDALRLGGAAFASGLLPRAARAAENTTTGKIDVLILGAGMAGLHAARMLEQAGMSVAVLEGSPRIGGRCWTKYDVPGCPELGAQQVGSSYGRVRGNAAELGIEMIEPPKGSMAETRLLPVAVSIGGAPPTPMPWPDSPMNHLAADERNLQPLQLMSHYLLKNDPLVELDDWQKPQFRDLDQMSLRQYLSRQGASPEALRLMDVAVAAWNLDDANALDFLRKTHYYFWDSKHGPYHVIKGGTSALTDAMAASLKRPAALNKIITGIHAEPERVSVTCRDGSSYQARACISTIPLSVMTGIPISGAVSDDQRQAWRRQRYNQLIQIYLRFKSPFWEKDGLPGTTWTDGPFELIAHTPSTMDANGVLYAYINGAATEALNRLSPRAMGERFIKELVRLRPAAAGQVEVAYIHNWTKYPFAKGHVGYFAPGDIGRYGEVVGQPVGALYFAGEHLCRVHAGIEGACETAETAAIQVLDAIGKG